jgi:aspartyl-tRNA(Asn)/glutamyl-tRNA(Gln) amidotransferase subunit C
MKITAADVQHVARLAEMNLEPGELEALTGQLDRIVSFVAQLEALPAGERVSPFHPGPAQATLRPDEVAPVPLARPLSELAPEFRDGLLVVPRLGAQEEP